MPAVPYKPVPDVGISQQGISPISVQTPAAAFGAGIGEAIGSVGRSVEHASDEIFKRAMALKQLENETEAREADAEFTIALGSLRANYHSLEGKNAVAAFPQYQKDVRELQQSFSAGLSNPMARRTFDRESRGAMSRTIFSGAGHAAGQNRRWAEGASVARVDTAISSGLQDQSPTALLDTEETIRNEAGRLGDLNGWDDAQTDRFIREKTSAMLTTAVRGMARNDPFEAQRFFEANRNKFDDKDIDRAEQIVKTNLYRVGALRISDEVNDQPIEGGENLETRIERGQAKAKELVPNDPEFPGYVRDQIITKYNRMGAVRREAKQERHNLIDSALAGGQGDGQRPSSPDELRMISPEIAAAWDSMGATEQRRFMNDMANISKGDVAWTPARLEERDRILGLSQTNPEEFMALTLSRLDIPISERIKLQNLRAALMKRSGGDPRVQSALQMLRPMLSAAGITSRDDPARYQQFVGGLIGGLQEWQSANPGKTPKKEDYDKIAATLIGNQRDPAKSTFFGLMPDRTTPLFEQSLPQQLLEDFKADPRWQGREPSEGELEQFRQQYIRKRFQEVFGGPASGGGAAKPVPTQSFPAPFDPDTP